MIDAEEVGRLDVRVILKTEDEALIYVQYHGLVVANEPLTKALAEGGSTEYGETHFVTQPRFETGALATHGLIAPSPSARVELPPMPWSIVCSRRSRAEPGP